jgi:hypothetical protein
MTRKVQSEKIQQV